MTKKDVKRWKVIAKNGVVLGIFGPGTQLQAWQQCCKEMGLDSKPVKSIEPGLKFETVDDRDWKPTHVIVDGPKRIEVIAQETDGYPNVMNLFTRDEWINHEMNHWDWVDGKKLRRNGKEQPSAAIVEKKS